MVAQVGIWSVGDDLPVRVERSSIGLEADLELWVVAQPSLLSEGLQVVGKQLHVDAGFIDVLCLDATGRWVIVELKKARLYRDAIVQAIDYASCVQTIDGDSLRSSIEEGLDRLSDPESVLESVDYQIESDDQDREVAIIVAGAGVDPGLERVVNYLGKFEIPIRVVSFDVFEATDGSKLLVREVLDEEMSKTATGPPKKSRTVAEIGAVAHRDGLGEAFDQIVTAAEEAGLFCRPYKHSVMVTPPTHKNRCLMVLTPREGVGLRMYHAPDALAEFFPALSVQKVKEDLGASDESYLLTQEDWQERTQILVDFLEQLPAAESSEGGPKADAESVFPIAALIRPGEWTTYGDISSAATGRSSAAMAIGTMARSMSDFPNPHRILNLQGQIPGAWRSDDGQGPEECRRRLEAEGITFTETGTASSDNRLPLEELIIRVVGSDA